MGVTFSNPPINLIEAERHLGRYLERIVIPERCTGEA